MRVWSELSPVLHLTIPSLKSQKSPKNKPWGKFHVGTMRELVMQPTNRFVSVIVAAADLIVFSSYLSTGIEKDLCECVCI